jgi:hypothetical protein
MELGPPIEYRPLNQKSENAGECEAPEKKGPITHIKAEQSTLRHYVSPSTPTT